MNTEHIKKITAIVPNFNHGHCIGRAVECLNGQSRKPDEIVIVDDGSSDNSNEIINALSKAFNNIRVIKNSKNLGVVRSLNLGLQIATGDLIYCGAADDYVGANLFCELEYATKLSEMFGFVTAEAKVVDPNGKMQGVRPAVRMCNQSRYFSPNAVKRNLEHSDNLFLSVVTLYDKKSLLSVGGFDERIGPFCDSFALRQIALRYGFVFVPKILGVWVRDPKSYSQSLVNNLDLQEKLIEKVYQKAKNDEFMDDEYAYLLRKRLYFFSNRLRLKSGAINFTDILAKTQSPFCNKILAKICEWLPKPILRRVIFLFLIFYDRPVAFWPILRTKIMRCIPF